MPSTASVSTTRRARSPRMRIDLDDVGLDRGGHVLVARALAGAPAGTDLEVVGSHPLLGLHLGTWCRAHGHGYEIRASDEETVMLVRRGPPEGARWDRAIRAGDAAPLGLMAQPPAEWGLAARGALVERGGPTPHFALDERDHVWAVQVMTYLVENEQIALLVPARFLGTVHPYF